MILLVTNNLKQLFLDSIDTQRWSVYVPVCGFTEEFMSHSSTTTASTRSQQNYIFHVTTNQIVLPNGRYIRVNYSLVVVAGWFIISFIVIVALKDFVFRSILLFHFPGTLDSIDVFFLVGIHFCLGFRNSINNISITLQVWIQGLIVRADKVRGRSF